MAIPSFLRGISNPLIRETPRMQPLVRTPPPVNELRTQLPGMADGFDTGRVGVGAQSGSKIARDSSYVTSLYQQLLGREPDAAGFAAHMNGLANGMRHEEVLHVFLTSPEYQARQASGATNAPARGAADGYDHTNFLRQQLTTMPPNDPARAEVVKDLDLLQRAAAGQLTLPPRTQAAVDTFTRGLPPHERDVVIAKAYELASEGFGIEQTGAARFGANLTLEMSEYFATGEPASAGLLDQVSAMYRSGEQVFTQKPELVNTLTSNLMTGMENSKARIAQMTAAGTPGATPFAGYPEPGGAIASLPQRPEFVNAPIDRSSMEAAIKSAATWVKQVRPELFNQGDNRAAAYEAMTMVIGALRAAGVDAHRVVNHKSRPVGDPGRYGSDALVVQGRIIDVYGDFGEKSTPQVLDQGPYEAGRLRD